MDGLFFEKFDKFVGQAKLTSEFKDTKDCLNVSGERIPSF